MAVVPGSGHWSGLTMNDGSGSLCGDLHRAEIFLITDRGLAPTGLFTCQSPRSPTKKISALSAARPSAVSMTASKSATAIWSFVPLVVTLPVHDFVPPFRGILFQPLVRNSADSHGDLAMQVLEYLGSESEAVFDDRIGVTRTAEKTDTARSCRVDESSEGHGTRVKRRGRGGTIAMPNPVETRLMTP